MRAPNGQFWQREAAIEAWVKHYCAGGMDSMLAVINGLVKACREERKELLENAALLAQIGDAAIGTLERAEKWRRRELEAEKLWRNE